MRRTTVLLVCGLLTLGLGTDRLRAQDRDTKVRNDRTAFGESKDWIYNDLTEGIRVARQTHKPLMVVFRCIPCEACQNFDDDVARRDPIIRDLLDQFVCVRIVQANTMDLSHFQFDFDLSFSVFFLDQDLTIYGRFGTRSNRPESDDISLEGLRKAMSEALRIHGNAAAVKPSLARKQARPTRFKTPRDFPSLSGRYQANLDYSGSVARSCIHCHQIRDAERRVQHSTGGPMADDVLFPYPDPEVVGLRMDPAEMAKIASVASGSTADHDGFKTGDEIVSLDEQPLLSIADVQWVLHHASPTAQLTARVRRDGKMIDLTMALKDGWRHGNISWRATTWQLRQMGSGGMKLENLKDEDRRQANLPPNCMALKVIHVGEFGEHAVAKRAGLQKGDIVVSFGDKNRKATESELLAYALQQKRRGDKVEVEVVRDGERKIMSFILP